MVNHQVDQLKGEGASRDSNLQKEKYDHAKVGAYAPEMQLCRMASGRGLTLASLMGRCSGRQAQDIEGERGKGRRITAYRAKQSADSDCKPTGKGCLVLRPPSPLPPSRPRPAG